MCVCDFVYSFYLNVWFFYVYILFVVWFLLFFLYIILVIVCYFILPPHGHCRDVVWGLTACDIRVSGYFSEALRSHRLTKVPPKHNLLPLQSKCDCTTTTSDDVGLTKVFIWQRKNSEWMKWVTQAAFLTRHEMPPWATGSSRPPSLLFTL